MSTDSRLGNLYSKGTLVANWDEERQQNAEGNTQGVRVSGYDTNGPNIRAREPEIGTAVGVRVEAGYRPRTPAADTLRTMPTLAEKDFRT